MKTAIVERATGLKRPSFVCYYNKQHEPVYVRLYTPVVMSDVEIESMMDKFSAMSLERDRNEKFEWKKKYLLTVRIVEDAPQ